MTDERTGYAVIAQMLGVDVTVLRAVSEQWAADPTKPAITWIEFEKRLTDAQAIAEGLNNTNLWELAIREAMDQTDIPLTLPTAGVPRLVVHEGGKQDQEKGNDESTRN